MHYLVECGKTQRHCLYLQPVDSATPYRFFDHDLKHRERDIHAHFREVFSHFLNIVSHLLKRDFKRIMAISYEFIEDLASYVKDLLDILGINQTLVIVLS